MLVCVNMCKYLRLCDNQCDYQVNPVGEQDHCGDCRKRKDHEDDDENEHKFSKHSPDTEPDSGVSFMLRKWSKTEVDGQNGNFNSIQAHAPILDEKYSEASSAGNFAWMQRPRLDSFKENEKFEGNNNNNSFSESLEPRKSTKGRFIIESLCDTETLSLSEKHRAGAATGSGKSSSKRSNKTKQLSRKLSVLQSKIETESEVYQAKMGYRPSHADKMKCEEISDLMQEKEKIRLELKDLNDDYPRKKSIDKTFEKERDKIVAQLDSLRLSVGRPYELDNMTPDQMVDERRDMKGLLTEFEKKCGGGPLGRRDKELMADLYERYRAVRRLCRRQSTGDLISIPEHTPLDLSLASPRQMRLRANSDSEAEMENIEVVRSESREAAARLGCDLKWHHMTRRELYETLGKLKESKKVYKRQINEVESGTSTLETDSQVYALYKATKCNIKLIKALIEKQGK